MNVSSIVVNIVLGVFSGLAASIGFWVWTTRLKHPIIKICPALSYYEREGKYRSTVALINQGKRSAADISIIAELSLHGVSGRTKRVFNIALRVREERLPYLAFAKEEQYFLRPSDIVWNYKDDFRRELPSKLGRLLSGSGNPEISLREILEDAESEGVDARIQVFVIANDSVYGATSYPAQEFRSRDFLAGDFVPGRRCSLLGESGENPNCCQFASSLWDFLRHRAYYQEINSRRSSLEDGRSQLSPDLPVVSGCESAPSNLTSSDELAVVDRSQVEHPELNDDVRP